MSAFLGIIPGGGSKVEENVILPISSGAIVTAGWSHHRPERRAMAHPVSEATAEAAG